jgi:hypothetical protein
MIECREGYNTAKSVVRTEILDKAKYFACIDYLVFQCIFLFKKFWKFKQSENSII